MAEKSHEWGKVQMIIISSKEVVKRLQGRFRGRSLEWEHSVIMTLWGLIVLFNPSQFEGPGFVAFKGGPYIWGSMVLLAGLTRFVALCVNGYMARPTALVRALGAGSGIVLFAAISLGFLFSWRWSTALAVYPVVGFFTLFSLYWSVIDVAIPEDHKNGTANSRHN